MWSAVKLLLLKVGWNSAVLCEMQVQVTSGCSDHHDFEVIPSSLDCASTVREGFLHCISPSRREDAMLSMLLTGLVLCLLLEHCNMLVCAVRPSCLTLSAL
eukprot:3415689-Amphidinium_carterae.1